MQDRSFTFILKTPPASVLLAKAAGVPKGSGAPNTLKVGKITQAQLKVSHDPSISAIPMCQSFTRFVTLEQARLGHMVGNMQTLIRFTQTTVTAI